MGRISDNFRSPEGSVSLIPHGELWRETLRPDHPDSGQGIRAFMLQPLLGFGQGLCNG